MRPFLFAVSFLSALPVPGADREVAPRTLAWGAALFPAVGLILGGLLYLADLLLGFTPGWLSALLLVVLLSLLTRGLHLDGLADTADALGSGQPRERALEIMRDPRLGTFGVLALLVALSLKVAFLAALALEIRGEALLLFPMLARWPIVWAVATQPAAVERPGLGRSFSDQVGRPQVALATAITIVAAWLLYGPAGILLLSLAGIFAVAGQFYLARRFGGITGDTLGALIEATEVWTLFALVWLAGSGL